MKKVVECDERKVIAWLSEGGGNCWVAVRELRYAFSRYLREPAPTTTCHAGQVLAVLVFVDRYGNVLDNADVTAKMRSAMLGPASLREPRSDS